MIRQETQTQPVNFNNLAVLSQSQSEDQTLTFQSIMKKYSSPDKALIIKRAKRM